MLQADRPKRGAPMGAQGRSSGDQGASLHLPLLTTNDRAHLSALIRGGEWRRGEERNHQAQRYKSRLQAGTASALSPHKNRVHAKIANRGWPLPEWEHKAHGEANPERN